MFSNSCLFLLWSSCEGLVVAILETFVKLQFQIWSPLYISTAYYGLAIKEIAFCQDSRGCLLSKEVISQTLYHHGSLELWGCELLEVYIINAIDCKTISSNMNPNPSNITTNSSPLTRKLHQTRLNLQILINNYPAKSPRRSELKSGDNP